jgi:NTP pyrophosphatase (non-canonical NTP hydrolase)
MDIRVSKRLLMTAVELWGTTAQLLMLIEETTELNKEIYKTLRGDNVRSHVVDEMADVIIMIDQTRLIMNITQEEVQEAVDRKLIRLNERIIRSSNERQLD